MAHSCVGDGQDGGNSTACCHRVLSFDSACILISVRCLLCGIERIGVGMRCILISSSQRALCLSLVSFPSPFFVSHTITHTPSSHDLRPFHHQHTLSLTQTQWSVLQRKRRGHLKRDSEQGQIDRSILAPLLHALSPHTHTISISPFPILYFIPSSLSFYSHLRHSDDQPM